MNRQQPVRMTVLFMAAATLATGCQHYSCCLQPCHPHSQFLLPPPAYFETQWRPLQPNCLTAPVLSSPPGMSEERLPAPAVEVPPLPAASATGTEKELGMDAAIEASHNVQTAPYLTSSTAPPLPPVVNAPSLTPIETECMPHTTVRVINVHSQGEPSSTGRCFARQ